MSQPLPLLQNWLKGSGYDAFILNCSDHHLNEYVSSAGKGLAWLSGFQGSTGLAIIFQDKALLFVDGRYVLQAKNEVNKGFEVTDWTLTNIKEKLNALGKCPRVAYDAWTFSHQFIHTLEQQLGFDLLPLEQSPIDLLWKDRPAWPDHEPWILDKKYTGLSYQEKLQNLQRWLQNKNIESTLLTDLPCIAWLFNLRGSDLKHTPVSSAWSYIPAQKSPVLFLKKTLLSFQQAFPYIKILPYDDFASFIQTLSPQVITIDPEITPQAVYSLLLKKRHTVQLETHFCIQNKAIKNKTEIEGFRQAHLYDGIAMCEALARITEACVQNKTMTEHEVGQWLSSERLKQKDCIGLSFSPIVGFRENGAVIHYHPSETSSKIIQGDGLLLIDSGGQYKTGTTDVTRTIALGNPTEDQKNHYTLVLKGHIAVAKAVFSQNAPAGIILDGFARQFLWQKGCDFAHGTGHGVGHCLNVHEGPYNLSPRARPTPIPARCVLSNEPGYYHEGHYGIRIESLVVVQQHITQNFLSLETLTLVPIDTTLIQRDWLTAEEISWLNQYHQKVSETIYPYLSAQGQVWLREATQPL